MKLKRMAAAATCLVAAASTMAATAGERVAPQSLAEAVRLGKPLTNFRLRDEIVQQDGKADDANALTLRSLLGWQTAPLHGLSVGAQLINVAVFDDAYDNGDRGQTQPGRASFARIADPDYTGINQLYLDWTGLPGTTLRAGRQAVKLDNVRFVGNVEFRQVMQVFDGVSLENKSLLPGTTLFAAHFSRVTQVSTQRQDTAISLFNARYALSPTENLIGYGYFVGWDAAALQSTSSRTLGVRLDGIRPLTPEWKLQYTAEYAKQDPYKDGSANIDSDYTRLGGGLQHGAWFARIDQEVLSSNDGLSAFQTPLGTNHLFQGWADKFLVTPQDGLRDRFVTVGTKLGKFTLASAYHWLDADRPFASGAGRATRYGTEWDVSVAYPFSRQLSGKIEAASFRERDPYTLTATSRIRDTDKVWLTLMYVY